MNSFGILIVSNSIIQETHQTFESNMQFNSNWFYNLNYKRFDHYTLMGRFMNKSNFIYAKLSGITKMKPIENQKKKNKKIKGIKIQIICSNFNSLN